MIKTPSNVNEIETNRLILIPFTINICKEILENKFTIIQSLGLKKGKNWPDHETLETLPKIMFNLSKVLAPSGFESWMIIKKDSKEIIGDVGFKGYNTIFNKADIGYGIIANERKNGYAKEAVNGLIKWAFETESLEEITAQTYLDNIDSINLLKKSNFREVNRDLEFIYWSLERNCYYNV